ncbi:MAG: hypothetical protein FWD87_03010 [Spirochaetaceae bacterium]|nr:hypothetical protein [Spirochaetaceae bacterium]
MKKILIVFPFILIFLFSCRSAPAPAEPVPDVRAVPAVGVDEARNRAVNAMERARSIRADVAVRDDFNSALALFNEAEGEPRTAGNLQNLVNKYFDAERLFLAAHENTRVMREEAQRQLNRAREDIRQVETAAEAFDREQAGE